MLKRWLSLNVAMIGTAAQCHGAGGIVSGRMRSRRHALIPAELLGVSASELSRLRELNPLRTSSFSTVVGEEAAEDSEVSTTQAQDSHHVVRQGRSSTIQVNARGQQDSTGENDENVDKESSLRRFRAACYSHLYSYYDDNNKLIHDTRRRNAVPNILSGLSLKDKQKVCRLAAVVQRCEDMYMTELGTSVLDLENESTIDVILTPNFQRRRNAYADIWDIPTNRRKQQ